MSAKEIEEAALSLSRPRRALLFDLTVSRSGLIRGERVKRFPRNTIGDFQFSDLEVPFVCVATDLTTGETVVMDEGSVVDAVRASISIPAIFTPVKWKGRILIDGGITTPVPVRVLRWKGADLVIAVNVMPSARRSHISKATGKKPRIPNILDIILQTIYITSYQRVRANLRRVEIVIEPEVEDIGFGDFHKVKECISRGEEAARLCLVGTSPVVQAGARNGL